MGLAASIASDNKSGDAIVRTPDDSESHT